ncbi:hypothetical protein YC2023_094696 [Brassica napus]
MFAEIETRLPWSHWCGECELVIGKSPRVVRTMRKLISSDLFVCHGNSYEDDEHDLKMGVLRRSRQLLPAFAEVVYLLRLHQDQS